MSHTAHESGLFLTAPAATRGATASSTSVSVVLHATLVAGLFLAPLTRATEEPEVASSFRSALAPPVIAPPAPTPEITKRVSRTSARAAALPARSNPSTEHEVSRVALLLFTDPTAAADPLDANIPGDPGRPQSEAAPCAAGALCEGPVTSSDAAPGREPVRVGGAIAEPRLREGRPPVYPPLAIAAHVSGTVILEAHVLQDGRVHETRILRGHELFDEAALASVRSRRYEPLRLNGIPTDFLITITVTFKLRG